MKKRPVLVSLCCVLSTMTNVMAFGGEYPQSIGYSPYNEASIESSKNAYTPTDERYIFKVDGKSFILLDTDSEGNYFVMTEDHYGRHSYQTAVESHLALEQVTFGDSGYTIENKNQMNVSEWIFNPDNNKSIAYWLNNDFLANGNGKYILPDSIKNNIIEKTWGVEGFTTMFGSGKNKYDKYLDECGVTGYTPSRVNAEKLFSEPYTVNGKISLMSLTEYLQYQDIIGISFGHGTWGGMMLRSPELFITASTGESSVSQICYFGPLQVTRQTSTEDTTKPLRINIADAASSEGFYFVRPVFWLSKDFFKNVKCDTENMGKYPMEELKEHSYEELSKIYTNTELENLGIYYDGGEAGRVCPIAENVEFFGDASVGKTLTGRYVYDKNTELEHVALAEGSSKYQWYISNSANSEKIKIKDATELAYTPTEEQAEKYIWFSVTPKNKFSNIGDTVYSESAIKIRSENNANAEFFASDGTEIFEIGDNKTVKIKATVAEGKNAIVYILKFNQDRQLNDSYSKAVEGGSELNYEMNVSQDESIKVMILENSSMKPFCICELK